MFLPARAIKPNPAQPRSVFRQEALEELADSIRQHGVLQPLSVRRVGSGYELIAGERRLRAAQMAGLGEIPCIVMNMDDRESAMTAMVENLQRQDLDFVKGRLSNITDSVVGDGVVAEIHQPLGGSGDHHDNGNLFQDDKDACKVNLPFSQNQIHRLTDQDRYI